MQDDFWSLDDNSSPLPTDGTFDMGGGDFDPIPKGTQVLAAIEECKWNEYEGEVTIQAKWGILKPDDYKNRKVFQKIRIEDADTKKRDKAKRMLAAIDANASNGALIGLGRKPTNEDFAKHLCHKPMMLLLGVWEQNDKRGNWVMQVAPKGQPQQQAPKRQEVQEGVDFGTDDDIPF